MKLKIGHADIAVRPLSEVESYQERADGIFKPYEWAISVGDYLPPPEQARVLIHEVIHAIWSVYRHPNGDTALDEEGICQALDVPLAALFRDNPNLPAILQAALTGGVPIVTPTEAAEASLKSTGRRTRGGSRRGL